MTRGMKKIASIDIWEDQTVDMYVSDFPGSDALSNADWQWFYSLRNHVKDEFVEMMKKVRNHE
jgi:hypothetical protein